MEADARAAFVSGKIGWIMNRDRNENANRQRVPLSEREALRSNDVPAARRMRHSLTVRVLVVPLVLACSGCNRSSTQPVAASDNSVTLYCSVDQEFARPLIQRLEQKTGLRIAVLYDTESTKTAGLANRIRAERNRPRCDVYWASALLQTLLLSDDHLLQAYDSPARADLPARFRGKDWTGVGVRGRLMLASKARADTDLKFVPSSSSAPFALSNPAFGTASDWATAYATRNSDAGALNFFRQLKAKGARVLPGNGDVAREVAEGNLSFGWADTDDYLNQKREKKAIFLARPVKDNVLVPGAASLVAGAPHPENARRLIEALVSRDGEAALVAQMPGVFSLRGVNQKPNWRSGGEDFSFLASAPADDYAKWPASWKRIREPLAQILTP